MNAHLLNGIASWTDGPERFDETCSHLHRALQDQLPYHEESTAKLLLIGSKAKEHSAGLDAGDVQSELVNALDEFGELLTLDAARDLEYFNSTMEMVERIPVRTTLEYLDALNALIAQKLAEAGQLHDAIGYLDSKIQPLLKLTNPPALHMFTSQARVYLRRAVQESQDNPSDTASFRNAVECARKAVHVGESYDDSPLALEQIEWANDLLRRSGADRPQESAESEAASSSKCFVASAAFEEDHQVVAVLRNWRDLRLRRSTAGVYGIVVYELCSPRFAQLIRQSPRLRSVVRFALLKIVRVAFRAPL